MADISKIKMPSGNTYDIKDAVARQAIAGGMSKIIAWNGSSTPVVANIPAGVVVTYNDTDYTGTLAAADADITGFYFVYSSTQVGATDIFDEYTVVTSGNTKYWEKIGDTSLDLSSLGDLAYKDTASVTFTGGTTDKVIGSDATFSVTQPTITVTPTTTYLKASASGTAVSASSTDKCLGSEATFTTSVTPTTTNIKATASGTAVGASSTDKCLGSDATFTTTVTPSTSKLVTTTVPNVTAAGSASTWSFAMGTGDDAETLIISGANSTAPTLGTAITVATGSLNANGSGASVATGISSASTSANSKDEVTAITGVSVTTQPTVALATGATAGTGVISVATGITSATTSVNSKDEVTAITGVSVSTQPTIALATDSSSATGRVSVATGITSASASGGAVAWNSKDEVTAVTSIGTGTAS